ncbi:MAG: hypothetical protein FWC41_13050 [Firmicutes bacterium]|nr:hypothetical protein [Bacillota bacterium]
MKTTILILGIIFLIILVITGIMLLVAYIKYRKEYKKLKLGDDIVSEFYFKFLTIGWKIKNGDENVVISLI